MAIVPSNTRFIGVSSNVKLKERKSALINSDTQPYTIEDIAETVGGGGSTGGGGGDAFPPLDMVVEGNLGSQSTSFNYIISNIVPAGFTGEGSFPTKVMPQMYFGGWSGGTPTLIGFPNLEEAILNLSGFSTLITVSLPSIKSLFNGQMGANITINYNSELSTIDLSGVTYVQNGISINFAGNKLSGATMEGLFQMLVDSGAVNGSLNIGSQANAAPLASTLVLKQTLLDRNWSVTM